MKKINITNGEYLNNYLKEKNDGVFIPFNEAMIQDNLLYPLFDDKFILYRSNIHKVTTQSYLEKLNDFINIKNKINEIDLINLWFGKDAFCIINLLTVLVYLEDNNYNGKIVVNLVDDYTNKVLESDIEISYKEFKNIYINLTQKKQIKTNIDFIDKGIEDYLYITSNNNHILDYIKSNYKNLSEKELLIEILDKTYQYGLSDTYIISMIEKVKKVDRKKI